MAYSGNLRYGDDFYKQLPDMRKNLRRNDNLNVLKFMVTGENFEGMANMLKNKARGVHPTIENGVVRVTPNGIQYSIINVYRQSLLQFVEDARKFQLEFYPSICISQLDEDT